jgi:hypothetical protein
MQADCDSGSEYRRSPHRAGIPAKFPASLGLAQAVLRCLCDIERDDFASHRYPLWSGPIPCSSDAGDHKMDKAVARLNIEHFRRRLEEETDEGKRQVIARLLAEEEAKLGALMNASKQGSRRQ